MVKAGPSKRPGVSATKIFDQPDLPLMEGEDPDSSVRPRLWLGLHGLTNPILT